MSNNKRQDDSEQLLNNLQGEEHTTTCNFLLRNQGRNSNTQSKIHYDLKPDFLVDNFNYIEGVLTKFAESFPFFV